MFISELEKQLNTTVTENGDIAFKSTLNANLDLFALMGGMRNNHKDLKALFTEAYYENPKTAIKNLFYLRDVRNGMGERESFRTLFKVLMTLHEDKEFFSNVFEYIAEYGRYDDLLVMLDDEELSVPLIRFIDLRLFEDTQSDNPSLLAKWLPSINASSKKTIHKAKKIAKLLGIPEPYYRKMLSELRKKIDIVETKLVEKRYNDIDYNKVPGRAMNKYYGAFLRNDSERFEEYKDSLCKGEVVAKVKTLYPHEILKKGLSNVWGLDINPQADWDLIQSQWNAIERETFNSKTIVVRDGSGSMTCLNGLPLQVSTALSILFSEQLTGDFKDKFITFSSNPKLVNLSNCDSLKDKVKKTLRYDDVSNTDIQAVYNLIFETSKNIPEKDRINRVVIISDMEFDLGVDNVPTYETVKNKFESAGMKLPEVVFWNVNARAIRFPVSKHENVKLVSGFSPNILKGVMENNLDSAESFMLKTLEPYEKVAELIG
ncbi:DUF2828 family protein [Aerococcaceae bacterium zg-B36]|uniref:DUF2828 family protein n=1 Tax=Aerococcaceae bacterium zg-252 TaxID=2796928 RepID=UPI001BD8CE4D|nr:DUF2828 family protein [Aerococcaceae bacterium zg-B36]